MTGTIKLTYKGRVCTEITASLITSGSICSVTAEFDFDSAWDAFSRTAVFVNGETAIRVLLGNDNKCDVPFEVLKSAGFLTIGVLGIKGSQVIPTAPIATRIAEGITTAAEEPDEPTAFVYNRIVMLCQTAMDAAQSVRNDAAAGKFNGKNGDPGDAATIDIHGTSTIEPNAEASVENRGDSHHALLFFRIPRGKDGYSPIRGVDYWTAADRTALLTEARNESKISGRIDLHRYSRRLVILQNKSPVLTVDCAGERAGKTKQSWLFTDYADSGVNGDYSAMLGGYNTCMGNGNIVGGVRNDVTGRALLVFGEGNLIADCAEGGLFFGRYGSVNHSGVLVAIGNGSSANQRNNLFELRTDGQIRIRQTAASSVIVLTPGKLKELIALDMSIYATKSSVINQLSSYTKALRSEISTAKAETENAVPRLVYRSGRYLKDIILTPDTCYSLEGESEAENLLEIIFPDEILGTSTKPDVLHQYRFSYMDEALKTAVPLHVSIQNGIFLGTAVVYQNGEYKRLEVKSAFDATFPESPWSVPCFTWYKLNISEVEET